MVHLCFISMFTMLTLAFLFIAENMRNRSPAKLSKCHMNMVSLRSNYLLANEYFICDILCGWGGDCVLLSRKFPLFCVVNSGLFCGLFSLFFVMALALFSNLLNLHRHERVRIKNPAERFKSLTMKGSSKRHSREHNVCKLSILYLCKRPLR